MNIALVDDLPTELDRLESCLRQYEAIHQLNIGLSRFTSAEQLMADYRPLKYTVIFLDIYMEGMTGVEAAEKIRETDDDTILIFLTTSEEHRADAFRCHAYDYLQKPYTDDDVFRTMDHILRLHTQQDSRRFHFTCGRKPQSLRYSEILCLETDKNYLLIRDRKGESYRTRMTFSSAEQQLSEDPRFLTILRGVIVNMEYVIQISGHSCLLEGGIQLPINARNAKSLQQLLHNYHFAKIRKEALRKGGRL